MKRFFNKLIALVMTMAMVVGVLVLTACGADKNEGVDGTYTATVVTDMGDNVFTLTLSNGKDAQMAIQAGPISDSYFGTYTAEGNEVSVKGLNNPNNANSATPGLWNDIIDAETGDCEVTLNKADNTFTFKPTGNSSALPELPAGDNVYTYSLTGNMGTDTFTLTLGDDNVATMVIANAMFTDTYTGTYTQNGNEVAIKGLTGNTIMGENTHPGLFGDIIDAGTGDCEVTLNPADNTFTFKSLANDWEGGTVYENVEYADGLTMNVYVPAATQAELPLLVCFPGGGFNFCDPNNVLVLAKYFRDNGFVVATVNYSVGGGSYPQAVIDGKTAVQYLVDRADEYKIDTAAISVIGESAGSAVAALVSLSGASDFKAEGAEDYSFSVSTYIDFYGPVSNGNGAIGENVDGGVNNWLGSEEAVDLADYFTGMFSCKNIWIQHGDADTSVNYNHAVLFKSEIDGYNEAQTIPVAKINVRYEIIEGAVHIDPAFYTDENLGELRDWLYDVYGIVAAEVTATYTYTVETTDEVAGTVTNVFELKLYSDGSCTIALPDAGMEFIRGPFKGTYTLDGTTLTVTGLAGVPGVGAYTVFVTDGGFTATVDNAANTFTPASA